MKMLVTQIREDSTLPANITPPPCTPVSILRIKDFSKKAKVSVAWLYDRMNPLSPNHDEGMPPRIWLSGIPGKGPVGFLESAVDAWILSRAAKAQSALADQCQTVTRGSASRRKSA